MTNLPKLFFVLGLLFLFLSGLTLLVTKLNIPLGRLWGDFSYKSKNVSLYVPLATSLFLSLLLSIILNLVGNLKK